MVLRAGVIGCGRIGSEFDDDPKRNVVSSHCGAYSGNAETELVAVSDISAEKLEKAKKRWGVPAAYSDYKEMLAKEKLDIVSVCTLASTHLEIIEEAVKHKPKLIFCEKPLADNLQNARKIADVCSKAGVLLATDHQRRYEPFHREIKKFIEEGKLGKIQQASFYYGAGISNSGTHMLDLLRYYLGDAVWVQAHPSSAPSGKESDPNLDGLVRFRSGATAALQAFDVKHYLAFELYLYGEKGAVMIDNSGYLGGRYFEVADHPLFSGYKHLKQATLPFELHEPRQFMSSAISHLVECVKNGMQPACTGEDGAAAVELVCALLESAQNGGKKISLPLAKSEVRLP